MMNIVGHLQARLSASEGTTTAPASSTSCARARWLTESRVTTTRSGVSGSSMIVPPRLSEWAFANHMTEYFRLGGTPPAQDVSSRRCLGKTFVGWEGVRANIDEVYNFTRVQLSLSPPTTTCSQA
ncbi:hypothetical protein J6590_049759 [Homalodisca vitripennis]|nr:hypothetical protein J6590_092070 [Homalodisca vitripennis]KAG8301606.1 hypothetical protein J6590_049759 [Homalodisca vitripennis]